MSKNVGVEFDHETPEATAPSDRPVAPVELIATVALAFSTLVAVTAVSIGIARADVFGARTDEDGASLAIALFVGLLLTAMGGLTAVMADDGKPRN